MKEAYIGGFENAIILQAKEDMHSLLTESFS
jgi:hypothetical protein